MEQLEQKTRQLQMNPHFLNNAFHSIQSLIITNKQEEARHFLNEFALLMRLVLNHSRASSVPLEDEIELLKKYLSIERFITGNSFDYQIDFEEKLDINLINISPMMIQPFVENAIKHGVRYQEGQGQISIRFESISAVKIKCRIIDNGKGLEFSKSKKMSPGRESVSIEVLKKRMEVLHGRPGDWVKMHDTMDSSGTISGVEVVLILPVI